jgi:hypothetical protein
MTDTRCAQIQQSLVDRLKTITTANGYRTNVLNVYADEIPMGISLESYEVPAILVITGKSIYKYQTQCVYVTTLFELQLIHRDTANDTDMNNFVGDVSRAIHANSPTLIKNDAFRTFAGKPTSFRMLETDTDLNMIDANRFYCVTWEAEYHAHPTDL